MATRASGRDARNAANTPVGVLVIDDQPALRDGVARLIRSSPLTLREICTAGSGAEAREIATRLEPDVVVLDVDLHGEDGLELIGHLGPNARVLVLTSHGDAATREQARLHGAVDLIEKQQPASELLAAIVALALTQKH